jgi:ATP-dependent DNA ligase
MEFVYLVKLALGMVAKRRTSVYAEHGWLKIKNPKYTQAERRHDMFQACRGPVKKA